MVHEYKAKVDLLKDANQINSWCSNATHKKIPKIVDTITPNDVMVLINAIYFKGKKKVILKISTKIQNK
jgi:serpin B